MGVKTENMFPFACFTVDFLSNSLKYIKEIKQANRKNLAVVDKLFFIKHKALPEEALFILGSGESINSINENDWEIIKANRSMGLNQWITHCHVPSFYMLEGLNQDSKSFADLQSWRDTNIEKYIQTNRKVIVLAKDFRKSFFSKEFLKCIDGETGFIAPKFNIPGRTNLSKEYAIRLLSKFGILGKLPFFSRASITYAIALGVLLKFKKIVLCGVDLKDGKSFWQDSNYCKNEIVNTPPFDPSLKIHGTMNHHDSPVTVDQSVYAINEFYLKPKGVHLCVLSETSRLYPKLDKFEP